LGEPLGWGWLGLTWGGEDLQADGVVGATAELADLQALLDPAEMT
jgi:hypothetical protein